MPIIRDIIYGAAERGASAAGLCRKLGIGMADLNNSEKRTDFETACLSWEHAVKATGDPLLGLHIGESSNPSIMGLLGYLMQNSTTLIDAFRQVCDYGRVATNMFDYSIVEKNDRVILLYSPASTWVRLYPNGARQATDQAMAGTLNVFFLLSGRKVSPVEVEMSGPRKKDRAEYERVFRSALRFNSQENRLIFRRDDLLAPVLNHDRSLFRVFEQLVKEKRKAGQPKTFGEEIQAVILEDFKGQVPALEVLAARMNMTVRSLQRKLAAEKTTFRRISGQIRKEIASRLLSSTDQKVGTVANILGYSAPRSFRRAFKSWTGGTDEQ
ncbi:MAG TPA: AraC family transcriptional regulator [Cyclobacteriaceae bacterium]|nr:AraC family transcriptional regulator [Cyclobacteriaceae bacterium]